MNAGFVDRHRRPVRVGLGWCTYNADHMSMYNVNVSIPKTLVKFLVAWAAENEFDGAARKTLHDIVATEISPELLPTDAAGDDPIDRRHDRPVRTARFLPVPLPALRRDAGKDPVPGRACEIRPPYSPEKLRHWLGVFLKRFFANQFKRSCLPDGPKVGTVSLSPRGDWRMPSDAAVSAWLADI